MSKMEVDGSLPRGLEANPRACRCIPLCEVDNAVLMRALSLWQDAKGDSHYPPRSAITPRLLKPILRHTTLVRVIDGGQDYEFRIVGDASVMAHGYSLQGKRLSDAGTMSPEYQKFARMVFDRVVRDGEPIASRGWMARCGPSGGHVFCEHVYLPLGEANGGVDQLLITAVYLRRDGLETIAAASSSFTF